MKTTINRQRVIEIVQGADLLKPLSGVKFTYAIAKNMKGLTAEFEALKEANKPVKGMDKYNEEYKEILEAEAKRDAEGNLVQAGSGHVAIANPKLFQKKIKSLEEKFKNELAESKAKNEEFEKFMKEPFAFEFFQFEESVIPENITVEQMGVILEMVKE